MITVSDKALEKVDNFKIYSTNKHLKAACFLNLFRFVYLEIKVLNETGVFTWNKILWKSDYFYGTVYWI